MLGETIYQLLSSLLPSPHHKNFTQGFLECSQELLAEAAPWS